MMNNSYSSHNCDYYQESLNGLKQLLKIANANNESQTIDSATRGKVAELVVHTASAIGFLVSSPNFTPDKAGKLVALIAGINANMIDSVSSTLVAKILLPAYVAIQRYIITALGPAGARKWANKWIANEFYHWQFNQLVIEYIETTSGVVA